jgi:hypothetical protein
MKVLKILSLLILSAPVFSQSSMRDYVSVTGYGTTLRSKKVVIILRKFTSGSHAFYLTVDPESLITEIACSDTLKYGFATWKSIRSRFSSCAYIKAIQQAEKEGNKLQDAGFTRFLPSQKGIDLTIDLCPSSRPLDRIVFEDLIGAIGQVEKPVPVAISITGRWIIAHPDDLNWLKDLVKAGELSVVWINHSYNHYTGKNVPLKMNFLLEPGTDIKAEVLNTEIAMLQHNIIPSVFFRFPGLVSDRAIYDKILDFGLIPVGSDAWLAKGQQPTFGSIVLIHANGNEPVGVRDFIDLLRKKGPEILSERWELLDLRESLVEDESR